MPAVTQPSNPEQKPFHEVMQSNFSLLLPQTTETQKDKAIASNNTLTNLLSPEEQYFIDLKKFSLKEEETKPKLTQTTRWFVRQSFGL